MTGARCAKAAQPGAVTEGEAAPVSAGLATPSSDGAAAAAPARVLFIANPNSRSGGSGAEAAAIARLQESGVAVTEVACADAEAARAAVRRHCDRVEAVVVAGGDGSMNAVAPVLVETGLPLGIVPLGTGNDLARTLSIPADSAEAAAVVAAGRRCRVDLGEVNGHYFFNVASIGLSAELAQSLTGESKRRFGRLAYALAAGRLLLRARPFRATLVSPRETVRVRTLQIAVGNGRYYGGGMTVEREARIDDGHLDLYSLELGQIWKLAMMAPALRAGAHGLWREVRTERAQGFEVRTRRPRPVNTDGEIVTQTPARFRVHPGAVTIFVPP